MEEADAYDGLARLKEPDAKGAIGVRDTAVAIVAEDGPLIRFWTETPSRPRGRSANCRGRSIANALARLAEVPGVHSAPVDAGMAP